MICDYIFLFIYLFQDFFLVCVSNISLHNLSTAVLVCDLLTRSLALSQHFMFFALHSLLTHFRQCQLKCQWTVAIKLFLVALRPILTIPCRLKHSGAICRAPQIIECSVVCKKSAHLTWTNLIHWCPIFSSFRKRWAQCPVLFKLLLDPMTHRFTVVKTKKILL